jgi:hypothetical protein
MTNAFSIRELLRWLLAAGAVVVAFFVALYFSLFVLMFGPFPKDLAEPTAGFTMGLLVVLAGSLLAPRQRLAVALVLLVAGTAGHSPYELSSLGHFGWWYRCSRVCRVVVSCATHSAFDLVGSHWCLRRIFRFHRRGVCPLR